jgi:hypothetical protein
LKLQELEDVENFLQPQGLLARESLVSLVRTQGLIFSSISYLSRLPPYAPTYPPAPHPETVSDEMSGELNLKKFIQKTSVNTIGYDEETDVELPSSMFFRNSDLVLNSRATFGFLFFLDPCTRND